MELDSTATFIRMAFGEKLNEAGMLLNIMETLHCTLPQPTIWIRDLFVLADPFVSQFKQYKNTLNQLETQPTPASCPQLETLGSLDEIYTLTKGLPYYLNWLRQERQLGKSINWAEGHRAIENLLLQGQCDEANQVIYLAACCRWFDRPLIQYLVEQYRIALPFEQESNWFDWLIRQAFMKPVEAVYRLDDVARDVFRQSYVRNQPDQFCRVHDLLARRFKAFSDQAVDSRRPVVDKYSNLDWLRDRVNYLYYLFFSRCSNLP